MKLIENIFSPLTFWCLHGQNQVPVELFRKIRACLVLWASTGLFMWGYVLLSFFGFIELDVYKWGAFFSFLHALVPILFRYGMKTEYIGIYISAAGLCWQYWFCYNSGGVFSPAAVWFTIHPVILGFFGNATLVVISVVINILVINSLYFLEKYNMLPVDTLNATFADVMIISTFIGLDILIAAFTLMAVKINKKQNEEIQEGKDHIENLIRILSHDISNPLTIMKLVIDTSTHSGKPIEGRQVEMLNKAYKDMNEITDSVKKWIADSTLIFAKKEDDLSPETIQKHIKDTFNEKAQNKGVKLVFTDESKIKSFKTNKMILFHNVINNLLSNAIKFSSEGHSIFIKIHSNRNDFLITITDQGGGIDEDHLKTIFDPKLKISKKGTADEEGTGFGLPIAKKMISQIDGELSIDSMIFTEGDKTYGTRAEVKLRLGL